MAETERVVCPDCKTRISCDVVAEYDWFDVEYQEDPLRIRVVKCPDCRLPQILIQEWFAYGPGEDDQGWSTGDRLWPSPESRLSYEIPTDVRQSLDEARTCVNAGAFNAASVMCGRSIEAIGAQFGVKKRTLNAALKQLRDDGVIDGRLYQWADALRKHRNLGAHNSGASVSETDAKDLLVFTEAICNYVFVMTARFEEYVARQAAE